MDPDTVKKAIADAAAGKAVVLDVRHDDEWNEGHAAPAQHFELARLEAGERPEVPKEQPLYTYCKAGGRAQKAADILNAEGWTVTNIGGLSDWEAAGGPVTK